jgi:hypothetical protein
MRTHRRLPVTAFIAIAAAIAAVTLGLAATTADATGLTAGDIVGTGANTLSSSATPVFLDEYEPNGKLIETLATPISANDTLNAIEGKSKVQ